MTADLMNLRAHRQSTLTLEVYDAVEFDPAGLPREEGSIP